MKNKIVTVLSALLFSIAMIANESPAVIGGVNDIRRKKCRF